MTQEVTEISKLVWTRDFSKLLASIVSKDTSEMYASMSAALIRDLRARQMLTGILGQ